MRVFSREAVDEAGWEAVMKVARQNITDQRENVRVLLALAHGEGGERKAVARWLRKAEARLGEAQADLAYAIGEEARKRLHGPAMKEQGR